MYIEKYHHSLDFDVESYYKQFVPGIDYEQHWPIVCVSGSRMQFGAIKQFWSDLMSGKKRSKPSVCLNGGAESVHTNMVKTLGMTGISFSVLSACTSSAYALHQAGLISHLYNTPVVVAAADDIIHSESNIHHFNSLGAMSQDTGIPFDINSKGFRPGMGQCFYVVSHVPINPVARVKDMRFFTQPNEKTAIGSISDIRNNMFADVDISEVSWWNAHSPGTPIGDRAEYELFDSLCGDIPISSIKGAIGHVLASSYLVELAIALDGVAAGLAIGNVGITTPINNDPRIIQTDTPIDTKTFLKFNMGFGGKNVLSIIESLI